MRIPRLRIMAAAASSGSGSWQLRHLVVARHRWTFNGKLIPASGQQEAEARRSTKIFTCSSLF
ncbi:hypothetical protein CIK84_17910 [Glutamicibacter arilaitensis]|uniref:Uncharacterized protein n=1 Tax=Glutamicibacter arilaitensis TaxID=256701 RepID=A0A2N7RXQ7_9MICC|nr:hypothetical protein CIK84_17910 [Glutamicibacter arilaitensis]